MRARERRIERNCPPRRCLCFRVDPIGRNGRELPLEIVSVGQSGIRLRVVGIAGDSLVEVGDGAGEARWRSRLPFVEAGAVKLGGYGIGNVAGRFRQPTW